MTTGIANNGENLQTQLKDPVQHMACVVVRAHGSVFIVRKVKQNYFVIALFFFLLFWSHNDVCFVEIKFSFLLSLISSSSLCRGLH